VENTLLLSDFDNDISKLDRDYFLRNPRSKFFIRTTHPEDIPVEDRWMDFTDAHTVVFNVEPGLRVRVLLDFIVRMGLTPTSYYKTQIRPMRSKLKEGRPPSKKKNKGFSPR
jgi:hypothetical protein